MNQAEFTKLQSKVNYLQKEVNSNKEDTDKKLNRLEDKVDKAEDDLEKKIDEVARGNSEDISGLWKILVAGVFTLSMTLLGFIFQQLIG